MQVGTITDAPGDGQPVEGLGSLLGPATDFKFSRAADLDAAFLHCTGLFVLPRRINISGVFMFNLTWPECI